MPRVLILSNPRSGSTYLLELLNSHPDIHFESELLNDEVNIKGSSLEYLQENIGSHSDKAFTGFKVFPEQIFARRLTLPLIAKHLGVTQIIVLWRENILETLVSRRIAEKTGTWYIPASNNGHPPTQKRAVQTITIQPQDLLSYTTETIQDWNKIASEWPVGISPIYVKFEDLISNPENEIGNILSRLGCPPSYQFTATSSSQRQNPASVEKKVENYFELLQNLPQKRTKLKLNVKEIFAEKQIQESVISTLDPETYPFVPHREPVQPSDGWIYRVAEPFISNTVKQNVLAAIESGSISSAGYWPRLMSSKLKKLFQCPVAQPCCNGFTALMLAMQCLDLEEGDEIIMPSMSMVAVPNAAYFLKVRPMFADCAPGNYNPGWEEILAVSGARTKAVIVTHTYGVPTPDLEKIVEECQQRGWTLIEDISEAVGVEIADKSSGDGSTSTKLLGTFGDFACASLYVNKMIHAGDGGFVLARNPKLAARLTSLVNHGFTPSFHFVHFEPALNAKINGIGAAIACGCIDEIQKIMKHRSQVAQQYRAGLEGSSGAPIPLTAMPSCGPQDTPWVFGLVCQTKQQRTELRAYLAEKGIETRDFFFALHLQPAYFKKYDESSKHPQPRLPLCETLGSTGFYLPTHSNLKVSDLNYIISCIRAYYLPFDQELSIPPRKQDKASVSIQPGTFHTEIRTFSDSGSLKLSESRSHLYFDAVALVMDAERCVMQERWDAKMELIDKMKMCLKNAEQLELEMAPDMAASFKPYLEYFESQRGFEEGNTARPWLHEDVTLTSKEYPDDWSSDLQQIPTTSDPETLQLLLHLIREMRPETIWEIGCWMGNSTYLMAALCTTLSLRTKIYAADAFKWQKWMDRFTQDLKIPNVLPGKSFLNQFNQFMNRFSTSSLVQPVVWPYDITNLPIELVNQRPDLIYLDISQEDEDLEQVWKLIKPNLIPEKSVILFNGLSKKSIPFFTRHSDELHGIAKPATMAKAFLFRSSLITPTIETKLPKLVRRLNFQSSPSWTHHHKNLFCSSVAQLKERFHDPDAPIMFFPAIEEGICNAPELFLNNPWVGIIHSVPSYPDQFYTPDLTRLCSPRYAAMIQNCRGLFTLTQVQADFLQQNLPRKNNKNSFPIQPLKYPVEVDGSKDLGSSKVPALLQNEEMIVDLVMIGSFARDFSFFFESQIPSSGFRKVLVAGDEESRKVAKIAPPEVYILPRLEDEEYEKVLGKSIIFLALIHDGAANTIILECIARNVPILSPNFKSCIEYLGQDYPLLYDPVNVDFKELLTLEKVEAAIVHLQNIDKFQLSPSKFMEQFEQGVLLQSLPPVNQDKNNIMIKSIPDFTPYDVTISICSYKRTHHLPKILDNLWNHQDFSGRIQIIVWNNNDARAGVVRTACNPYIQLSNKFKSLELISSTQNHYCSVRFALPPLMKSDSLLICDDDVIPGPNFISFFLQAYSKHPKDILCVRGHALLPHKLNLENPRIAWEDYEGVRFKDDSAPEQFIHFLHADACLIPKAALREVSSVEMPDPSFALVDDYWMSFILNHRFGRRLRKLCTSDLKQNPVQRTDDSDQAGLALHTRPEVRDARIRLYIHHMLQSWPDWDAQKSRPKALLFMDGMLEVKEAKSRFWEDTHIGFNISSQITQQDVQQLVKMGVTSCRIGAVGIGKEVGYDLSSFLTEPEEQVGKLADTIQLLADHGISSVLTLDRRLASSEIWTIIAETFGQNPSVVGYDLINEPFTEIETDVHWLGLNCDEDNDPGIAKMIANYESLIQSIRVVDEVTPIIVEPSFWGRCYALKKFPISKLKYIDSNLMASFHFYEPMMLTQRYKNKGRFQFPGRIPIYDNVPASEEILVDETFIKEKWQEAKAWGEENHVKIFLGEFGICRNINGAQGYLRAGLNACIKLGLSGFLYSFRDSEWDAMNYEFGSDPSNFRVVENCLMGTIENSIVL